MIKIKNIAICLLVLSFFMAGCSPQAPVEKAPATAVEVTNVGLTSIQNEMVFVGQIKPYDSVTVSSKTPEKVKQTFFNVGEYVNEGDVLYILDEEDINNLIKQQTIALNQAEQAVINAQSGLSKVTGGQYESQIIQQQTGVENYQRQIDTARVKLDDADTAIKNAQVSIDNAQVAVDNAQMTLENAQVSIDNSQVAVNNAQRALDNATTTFENYKVLYNSGVASKSAYDSAENAYNQAVAGLEQANNGLTAAKNSYEQAKNGLTAANNTLTQAKSGYNTAVNAKAQAQIGVEQAETALRQAQKTLGLAEGKIVQENQETAQQVVKTAQTQLDSARISLEISQEKLKNTSVTAPMSGFISTKGVNNDEFTSQQTPAYTIIDSNAVKVNVKVSELIINSIAVGDQVPVTITTLQAEPFIGTIKTISPSTDQTNTYPVTIEVPNLDGRIKSGMFAEVLMTLEESNNTIILPINAVLKSDKDQYVYINDNGKAKKVIVTTGISDGKNIEILSGLSESDQVITKGQTFVSDGQEINVTAVVNAAGEE